MAKCKPGHHNWVPYKPEIIPLDQETFETVTTRLQCTKCEDVKGALQPDPDYPRRLN